MHFITIPGPETAVGWFLRAGRGELHFHPSNLSFSPTAPRVADCTSDHHTGPGSLQDSHDVLGVIWRIMVFFHGVLSVISIWLETITSFSLVVWFVCVWFEVCGCGWGRGGGWGVGEVVGWDGGWWLGGVTMLESTVICQMIAHVSSGDPNA